MLPHWLAQPYVRPPRPEKGKAELAAEAASLAKKAARVRRESFKPRPSVDPGDVWSTSSSMGSSADKRYAGMLGGVMAEDDG